MTPDAPPLAEGADVLVVYPAMFDRVVAGQVTAYVGTNADGVHIYRVTFRGGVWAQVPWWALTDITTLSTRPRAAFSTLAGHA